MAPRLIGRIKNILEDSLSDFLEQYDEGSAPQPEYPANTSFPDRVRSELGSAIARRYQLQKQLAELPDFETGLLARAERAIDAGDDVEAKSILRRKTKAKGAVVELESEIEDLAAEIDILEQLLAVLSADELTADQVLEQLAQFEGGAETKKHKKG
ncbi:MAG: hypothetical protein AAFZ91_14925 [Pseudomonadota bacterium]